MAKRIMRSQSPLRTQGKKSREITVPRRSKGKICVAFQSHTRNGNTDDHRPCSQRLLPCSMRLVTVGTVHFLSQGDVRQNLRSPFFQCISTVHVPKPDSK